MNIDWNTYHAAIWRGHSEVLRPVQDIDPVALGDLVGIDAQKDLLLKNTISFLGGRPANNALLWGSRGTGKSSLVKAVFNAHRNQGLRLVEVVKNDLRRLPEIVDNLRELPFKFIVYCDDFSFEENENTYIALKTILEGSIEPPPSNVLMYATSNRRHLVPEKMKDNQDTKIINGELHYSDTVEEKISLSDRFGLWLSFYPSSIDNYYAMVDTYFSDYKGDMTELHEEARLFAQSRASKSGRTARQFFNHFMATSKKD